MTTGPKNGGQSPRAIVEDVLTRAMTRELWTGNYLNVLPVTIQDFDLSGILPAVFYMFRFGKRRGKGRFLEVFGVSEGTPTEKRKSATTERVASIFGERQDLEGFENGVGRDVLADLLLAFCLENEKHAAGRDKPVIRAAPQHYMASWLDLPREVAHLRYVPELITAVLANQDGDYIEQTSESERQWFQVGRGFENNVLLQAFHQGVQQRGPLDDRSSDRFDEQAQVGIEQILTIRLAQTLGRAPDRLWGSEGEKIPNQRPVADRAASQFSEDIRRFVRKYAAVVPRQGFVDMLEACMALGLTTLLTSTFECVFAWERTGAIPTRQEQKPACLFVDCSRGVDRGLRTLAERSFEEFLRRAERFPVSLMALRLLDSLSRPDPAIKKMQVPQKPDATHWINLLGDILNGRREESRDILRDAERHSQNLAEHLKEDYGDAAEMLENDQAIGNPVWRLAEALTMLQGRSSTYKHLVQCLDSCLLIDRPNGLSMKRKSHRQQAGPSGGRKSADERSLVLTDPVLEYLVHLMLLPSGNGHAVRMLSFSDFCARLRERYGFHIDAAPSGLDVSNDILQKNRAVLERRLRDLGLLVGVNDAESMKRLTPRFDPVCDHEKDNTDAAD